MHFCQIAADCFDYYSFDSNNKVAEVIAYGEVRTDGNKSCTDKLEIVREIPWNEVLRIVNIEKIARVTATPGTATPGIATPVTGTNRLLILAVLIQKNRRSCYSISRQV